MLTGARVVIQFEQVDAGYLQDQKVKIELYHMTWRDISLKKYEGEEDLAAVFFDIMLSVTCLLAVIARSRVGDKDGQYGQTSNKWYNRVQWLWWCCEGLLKKKTKVHCKHSLTSACHRG